MENLSDLIEERNTLAATLNAGTFILRSISGDLSSESSTLHEVPVTKAIIEDLISDSLTNKIRSLNKGKQIKL